MVDAEQGNPQYKTPAAKVLYERRHAILEHWVDRVRQEVEGADRLQRLVLVDTAPIFLEQLAEALSEDHSRQRACDNSNVSEEHGGERARITNYRTDQIILEYQILRETILADITEIVAITERDRHVIHQSIDLAIGESVTAFVLVQSRLREQFVATLSHDLRNPLSAAKMSAQVMLGMSAKISNPELRENFGRLAQRVVKNANRADRMIQDLLDATLLQVGERISLNIAKCEIVAVLRDLVADLPESDQARVRLLGDGAAGHWDGHALRRAVENLVSNAIKYGEVNGPITIRATVEHERLQIRVNNLGPEIPLKDRELMFEAFRRSQDAKASGKKGWGIGLALVRAVAEAHGGSIGVDCTPEHGTTFHIDIPQDARPFHDAPLTEN